MATLDHISGAEPSTVTFKVRTVRFNQNSSNMHAEVLVLGDPDSTNALAAVLNAAPASTAWGLVTREAASRFNIGSTAADNAVSVSGNSTVFQGGTWTIRANLSSTSADNPVRANLSSTATDNPVAISGNSTAFQGGGAWAIKGDSTVFQGGTWTVGGASTVAPLAGSTWNTRPLQSSAADLQMTATPAAGSTWRTQPGSTLWASSAGFHFDSSGSLQVAASFTGSTGPLTISQLLDSSGGSVAMADSANNAIRANIVAGTVGFNLGTLQSSAVSAANSSALLVRIVGGPSSAVDCTIRALLSSTSADNPVLATIGTNLQSSVAPSSNSSGLIVRTVIDGILTTSSTNGFAASTSLSIQSSAAGIRSYVTAYSILSTVAGPSKVKFYSGSTMLWPMIFAAVSSAVSGANLAASAPGYLFRTKVAGPLTLQLGGGASTIVGWQVGVSYFRAP